MGVRSISNQVGTQQGEPMQARSKNISNRCKKGSKSHLGRGHGAATPFSCATKSEGWDRGAALGIGVFEQCIDLWHTSATGFTLHA
ncbi:hypothetical protein PanWU01x14_243610 [Parasponia andersonii]|uniref:Uncharacterized protein n=1 Tax=Parasponia andersonii TaxID=3476 RepID=A0A2P5BFN5_PARAD|nr:hypothetical protein PanWU01x14_243610 [Parasponia andersonii]